MPLSRLTYCAYLVHPMVIWWFYGTQEVLVHYSIPAIVMLFSGKNPNWSIDWPLQRFDSPLALWTLSIVCCICQMFFCNHEVFAEREPSFILEYIAQLGTTLFCRRPSEAVRFFYTGQCWIGLVVPAGKLSALTPSPSRPPVEHFTQACNAITRQPIQLSCSNHLRIRQVFQFRLRKNILFGLGVLLGGHHKVGVFLKFWPTLTSPGRKSNEPKFWLKFYWELHYRRRL